MAPELDLEPMSLNEAVDHLQETADTWNPRDTILLYGDDIQAIEIVLDKVKRTQEPLTELEHEIIQDAGKLWRKICQAVEGGYARATDLDELRGAIHTIQRAIMANAAARSYPELYRPLGGDVPGEDGLESASFDSPNKT